LKKGQEGKMKKGGKQESEIKETEKRWGSKQGRNTQQGTPADKRESTPWGRRASLSRLSLF